MLRIISEGGLPILSNDWIAERVTKVLGKALFQRRGDAACFVLSINAQVKIQQTPYTAVSISNRIGCVFFLGVILRYACDSGLDVAQEYRTYVRYPELAPEWFKDFGGDAREPALSLQGNAAFRDYVMLSEWRTRSSLAVSDSCCESERL
jgi:hypothetical protein